MRNCYGAQEFVSSTYQTLRAYSKANVVCSWRRKDSDGVMAPYLRPDILCVNVT